MHIEFILLGKKTNGNDFTQEEIDIASKFGVGLLTISKKRSDSSYSFIIRILTTEASSTSSNKQTQLF